MTFPHRQDEFSLRPFGSDHMLVCSALSRWESLIALVASRSESVTAVTGRFRVQVPVGSLGPVAQSGRAPIAGSHNMFAAAQLHSDFIASRIVSVIGAESREVRILAVRVRA